MQPLKLLSLYSRFANVTTDGVALSDILEIASGLGYSIPEEAIPAIQKSLAENPGQAVVEWAKAKLEDGTIARWLAGDEDSNLIYVRCAHCQQPMTLNLRQL